MTAENHREAGEDWDRWVSYAPRERIRALQGRKLARQAAWVYANSPFWRAKFEEAGVTPEEIAGVEDSHRLPFGEKADYRAVQRDQPPYGGLLCRPAEEIRAEGGFVWETTGTTGEPLRFLCSQDEYLRVDVNATCRILWMAGLRPGDAVAMLWPMTLWAVGHGIVDAARRLRLTVLPLGPSYSSEFRIRRIAAYEPTAVMSTPSYALRLAEVAEEEGFDPAALGTERVVVSGEPLTEPARETIGERWGVGDRVYNYYGFSEAFNCRSIECEHHDGIHLLEDLYYAEVLDPETGEPVPEGETGELVVTALEQRDVATGFRFRTGDLVTYTDEPCDCGRTTRRIEIKSRMDDMRTVQGVNVFPQAVEAVVMADPDLADEFRLVHEAEGPLDRLTVVAEPDPSVPADRRDAVRERLARDLEDALGGLSPDVELVEPAELDRFTFKADRWVDGD